MFFLCTLRMKKWRQTKTNDIEMSEMQGIFCGSEQVCSHPSLFWLDANTLMTWMDSPSTAAFIKARLARLHVFHNSTFWFHHSLMIGWYIVDISWIYNCCGMILLNFDVCCRLWVGVIMSSAHPKVFCFAGPLIFCVTVLACVAAALQHVQKFVPIRIRIASKKTFFDILWYLVISCALLWMNIRYWYRNWRHHDHIRSLCVTWSLYFLVLGVFSSYSEHIIEKGCG